MQWMATLGASTLPNAPMVGDFRNDGSKEIVVAVGNEYIEVLEGETGNKEPGKGGEKFWAILIQAQQVGLSISLIDPFHRVPLITTFLEEV